jgi:hypothetical protein
MELKEFIAALNDRTIVNILLEEGNDTPPVKIKTINTSDGFEFDFESATFCHPAYEKEKAEYLDKVAVSLADSHFIFHPKEIGIEEMRIIASAHAKQIGANEGNVGNHFSGGLKVTFGEDLATLHGLR